MKPESFSGIAFIKHHSNLLLHSRARVLQIDQQIRKAGQASYTKAHKMKRQNIPVKNTHKSGYFIPQLVQEKERIEQHIRGLLWEQITNVLLNNEKKSQTDKDLSMVDMVTESYYFEREAIDFIRGVTNTLPEVPVIENFYINDKRKEQDKHINLKTTLLQRLTGKLRNRFARAAFFTGLMLTGMHTFAQETVLHLTLQQTDGSPAAGAITITGDNTDIYDDAFDGDSAYVLSGSATALKDVTGNDITFGYDAASGHLYITLPGEEKGLIAAYGTDGSLLYNGFAAQGSFSVPVAAPGIVIFRYTAESGAVSVRKLAVTGTSLTVTVGTSNADAAPVSSTLLKSTEAASDYTVTYEDPQGKLETTSWTITIEDGTTATLSETVQPVTNEYWLYSNNSSPDGASIQAWKDGQQLLNATINDGAYETNHATSTATTITLDSLGLRERRSAQHHPRPGRDGTRPQPQQDQHVHDRPRHHRRNRRHHPHRKKHQRTSARR